MTDIHRHRLWYLLAAVALSTSVPLAMAQTGQQTEVTVTAAGTLTQRQVGLTYTGAPINQVQLSRRVSYRDLDLATPAGQAQLKRRVHRIAQQECYQLKIRYPVRTTPWGTPACVRMAVRGAMAQIASAR